jgi:hypothetical protein
LVTVGAGVDDGAFLSLIASIDALLAFGAVALGAGVVVVMRSTMRLESRHVLS